MNQCSSMRVDSLVWLVANCSNVKTKKTDVHKNAVAIL